MRWSDDIVQDVSYVFPSLKTFSILDQDSVDQDFAINYIIYKIRLSVLTELYCRVITGILVKLEVLEKKDLW